MSPLARHALANLAIRTTPEKPHGNRNDPAGLLSV